MSTDAIRFRAVPTVILRVGEAKIAFYVHLGVLCNASPVFNAALNGAFSESFKRSMNLPEDDPEVFERLVQWLYWKAFDLPPFVEGASHDAQIIFMHLARLYVAADKYGIIDLKNSVMDRFHKAYADRAGAPRFKVLDYVYRNTTAKAKLRAFLVASYVWDVHLTWYESDYAQISLCARPEFAAAVAMAMASRLGRNNKNPFSLGSSHFHEAVADEEETKKTNGKA